MNPPDDYVRLNAGDAAAIAGTWSSSKRANHLLWRHTVAKHDGRVTQTTTMCPEWVRNVLELFARTRIHADEFAGSMSHSASTSMAIACEYVAAKPIERNWTEHVKARGEVALHVLLCAVERDRSLCTVLHVAASHGGWPALAAVIRDIVNENINTQPNTEKQP